MNTGRPAAGRVPHFWSTSVWSWVAKSVFPLAYLWAENHSRRDRQGVVRVPGTIPRPLQAIDDDRIEVTVLDRGIDVRLHLPPPLPPVRADPRCTAVRFVLHLQEDAGIAAVRMGEERQQGMNVRRDARGFLTQLHDESKLFGGRNDGRYFADELRAARYGACVRPLVGVDIEANPVVACVFQVREVTLRTGQVGGSVTGTVPTR